MNSPAFGKVIIFGGILGIFSSWNGFMVAATRLLFAMGRAHMISPLFGRLHSRYRTPTAAIFLVGLICSLAPLFGQRALLWLVNISSFEAVISYLLVTISFIVLRKQEPELDRPYWFPHGAKLSILVLVCLIALLVLYSPLGLNILQWPYEGLIITLWYGMGLLMTVYTRFRNPEITDREREILIFGENYSRYV
jgi:amino acid transporter